MAQRTKVIEVHDVKKNRSFERSAGGGRKLFVLFGRMIASRIE